MKRFAWIAMTAAAMIVAIYTALVLLRPGFGAAFVAARRAAMPLALSAHLSGGLLAMALGPWQLNAGLRRRALGLATVSEGGYVAHVGFGLLAALWLLATGMAYARIRAGNRAAHRRWMIRSYSLTLAAVSLREILPLSLLAGIPYADAYQAVAWTCWVPNPVIAEWWILSRPVEPIPQ